MTDDYSLLINRLSNRLSAVSTPIALVVGSAMSRQRGQGVGDVKSIIALGLAEHPYLDPSQELLRAIESRAVDLGDIYREFMQRLIKGVNRAAADALVRKAVLQAWLRPEPPYGDGLAAQDLDGWQLTDGLVGLADAIVNHPGSIPVVVTTNFDPLIEVALRRRGIPTTRRVITADQPARDFGSSNASAVNVVYVHGFWHGAPTMHTEQQLTIARPRLQAAITSVLRELDVFVVGYGGWDDVITGALESLTLDDGAQTEVLWAFYESDPSILQVRNRSLLARVGRLIIEGLFIQYSGIDCHQLFSDLARPSLSGQITESESAVAGLTDAAPGGWIELDDALVTSASTMRSASDVRQFFNGRPPDWSIVNDDSIPELSVVDRLTGRLLESTSSSSVWQILLASAGDGKSTALMQAALRLRRAGWRVVWRPHPGVALRALELSRLAGSRPTVLIIDDADNVATELLQLFELLRGGANLHLLAASRLSDWRDTRIEIPLSTSNVEFHEATVNSLTRREGIALVEAWAEVPRGLGKLAEVEQTEERLTRLLDAVAADRRNMGSLLGGLFLLRYDRAGLDSHVSDLLSSLQRRQVENSHVSLLNAFAYVAAIEAAGLSGIDRRLWAELLGIDVKSLRRTVEFSLGLEAATARAGGIVQVRHPQLALSAVRLMRGRQTAVSLSSIYEDLVRGTIELGKVLEIRDYSWIVHIGTQLPAKLAAAGIPQDEAFDIAIGVARVAMETEPNLLVYQTDYGSLLRKSGDYRGALEHYRGVNSGTTRFKDRHLSAGWLWDWAMTLLDAGQVDLAVVALLSSWRQEAEVGGARVGRYLTHLSRAFLMSYHESKGDRNRLALAGLLKLAELLMVSQSDFDWCKLNAQEGLAPPTDSLDLKKAVALVEKAMAPLIQGASDANLGALRADLGDFEERIRRAVAYRESKPNDR